MKHVRQSAETVDYDYHLFKTEANKNSKIGGGAKLNL